MRIWSETDGRADVLVRGYSIRENLFVALATVMVLGAAILVVAGLS